MASYYKCSVCRYTSERYYNVTRHEFRIHSASIKRRQCCDLYFTTKGDYYLHCEKFHPLTTTLTSRTKYKMYDLVTNDCTENVHVKKEPDYEKIIQSSPYMLRNRGTANKNTTIKKQYEEFEDFESKFDRVSEKNFPLFESPACETSISSETSDTSVYPASQKSEKNIELNDEIMNYANSNNDVKPKNLVSDDNIVASESCDYLPIKKRILRDITATDEQRNHMEFGKSLVERLYRRIKSDSGLLPKGQKKSHLDRRMKKKNIESLEASNDTENQSPVEVRVDPRISWHDFTQVHREFMTTFFEIDHSQF